MKRQELIIEALVNVEEPVRVLFAGEADSPQYLQKLKHRAAELGVEDKIQWLGRISEEEKFELYAKSLMIVFPPVDEDYGYVTPEAMLSSKAVLTLSDAGGPTEFVVHDKTGLIVEPKPEIIAQAMDLIWANRHLAEEMGANARAHIAKVDLSWTNILEKLL